MSWAKRHRFLSFLPGSSFAQRKKDNRYPMQCGSTPIRSIRYSNMRGVVDKRVDVKTCLNTPMGVWHCPMATKSGAHIKNRVIYAQNVCRKKRRHHVQKLLSNAGSAQNIPPKNHGANSQRCFRRGMPTNHGSQYFLHFFSLPTMSHGCTKKCHTKLFRRLRKWG
jgi:hypothetical protein